MHRLGEMDTDVSPQALDALVAELDDSEPEHPDVAVMHESEWCLSAFPNGLLVWENVEDGEARHRTAVARPEVRRLFGLLAQGNVQAVEEFGWQPGYR
jgi:hypothetical protein